MNIIKCKSFVKVVVLKIDVFESEILDERNVGTIDEAKEIEEKLTTDKIKCVLFPMD